eukprot:TRINITY_DN323_c0_g1_i1.p1 TRINITY_DN323_c0_g1~~TRINITY_DN323_c0_g1_i1.p1  ORF type:complete len:170 (-),score=51.08 TRINITY_DN323_c0_g1_i1:105-614(-)
MSTVEDTGCCGPVFKCCKAIGNFYTVTEKIWGFLGALSLFVGSIVAYFYSDLADSFSCGSNEWAQNATWYSLLGILTFIGALLILSYTPWKWYAREFGFFKSRIGRFLIKGITGWMLLLYGVNNSLTAALVLGAVVASAALVHFIGLCPCILTPKEEGYVREAGTSVSA